MLKAWFLYPTEITNIHENPWWLAVGEVLGDIVVIAKSEAGARRVAHSQRRSENGCIDRDGHKYEDVWLNPVFSNCVELTSENLALLTDQLDRDYLSESAI